jgi:phosphohistidine phosphatase
MRRLLLLRHAKSERGVPGSPDRDRTLNDRGRANSVTIGAYMARHRLEPELALVSPAARARETWGLASAEFEEPPSTVFDDRIYEARPQGLFNLIAETRPEAKSLLLVGHNPALHELAAMLIASGDVEARQRLAEALPTAGLVVIDLAFNDWSKVHPHMGRLERFVTPRMLSAATD